jgi:hypothetical protein
MAIMSFFCGRAAAYNSLFIGHSFFRPIAEKMPMLTSAAELNHSQAIVFSGGASGWVFAPRCASALSMRLECMFAQPVACLL